VIIEFVANPGRLRHINVLLHPNAVFMRGKFFMGFAIGITPTAN
jgi:hypothetical protein